jgi:glutamate transport system substrate-binding protein
MAGRDTTGPDRTAAAFSVGAVRFVPHQPSQGRVVATAVPPPAPGHRRASLLRGRRWTLARSIGVVVTLLVLLAAVVLGSRFVGSDRQSVDDYKRKSGIYGHPVLRIGVRTDQPLMGNREPDGRYSGFDIEVARNLARLLGYPSDDQVVFTPVEVSDRERVLLEGRVDLVVASYSITRDRQAFVRFAGPYLITTQEVMVRAEDRAAITSLEDLGRPRHVCTPGGSTSELNLRRKGIQPLIVLSNGDCIRGLLAKKYDAISTDETVLAGYLFTYPGRVAEVNVPFGPEELGIGVSRDDPWLQGLVNYFLRQSRKDADAGRTSWWQAAYRQTLERAGLTTGSPTQPVPQNVPDLVDHGDRVQGFLPAPRPPATRRRRRRPTP